jgi:hypothetical protein
MTIVKKMCVSPPTFRNGQVGPQISPLLNQLAVGKLFCRQALRPNRQGRRQLAGSLPVGKLVHCQVLRPNRQNRHKLAAEWR